MKILSIETSCDDTAIAILEVESGKAIKFKALSNIVSSQTDIHKNYGGVFPMMAKREHQANLVPVLTLALKQAKLANPKSQIPNPKQIQTLKQILEKESTLFESVKAFLEKHEKPDVDFIAITNGPGLEPCLHVGVNFAKALSYFWNIPAIPVNHIEAHILVNFLDPRPYPLDPKKIFPAISLIVSGGHTQLILVKGIGKYKIIGETLDDAAGECFDKAARILGLGYPGGPVIADIALKTNNAPKSFILPRPMHHSQDYNFSFSGLKTAILYKVRDMGKEAKSEKFLGEICVEIQQAIIDVLIKKTISAAKDFKTKTIILGGGVSANQELRKQLKEKIQKEIPSAECLIPDIKHSTDNALMIAVTGFFHRKNKKRWQSLKTSANLRIGIAKK